MASNGINSSINNSINGVTGENYFKLKEISHNIRTTYAQHTHNTYTQRQKLGFKSFTSNHHLKPIILHQHPTQQQAKNGKWLPKQTHHKQTYHKRTPSM